MPFISYISSVCMHVFIFIQYRASFANMVTCFSTLSPSSNSIWVVSNHATLSYYIHIHTTYWPHHSDHRMSTLHNVHTTSCSNCLLHSVYVTHTWEHRQCRQIQCSEGFRFNVKITSIIFWIIHKLLTGIAHVSWHKSKS